MGAGIFSGLEDLGLGDLKDSDIYQDSKEKAKKKEAEVKRIREEDMLFDKTYECPICNHSFKERTLRTGKARLLGTDQDLRARFEGIEPLKYDVVMCPKCGYTAISRYFGPLPAPQRKLILEKISSKFKERTEHPEVFTYEEAINRYKLALVNAMVKLAKTSEKAYICLRAGWLVRTYEENLMETTPLDRAKLKEMQQLENEFLQNAYDGFIKARETEGYPMCGMDESTVDYLIATLSIRFGHYDVASKIISTLLTSPSCNSRMKDKVRDLKDDLISQMREQSE